jgi:hypothetical protein
MESTMARKKADNAENVETQAEPKPRRSSHDLNAKVRILSDGNPKKPGTKSFDRFALYRDGMTVAEALDTCVRPMDLKYDLTHKYVVFE